ncbi:MAG: TraR/DksA family transcriptional regulator [Lapillicoccus sp.]
MTIASKAVERLAEERALVSARLGRMEEDMTELFAASRDANADDEHDPEGQTIAYERSQLSAMIRQARAHLDEIDAAGARLSVGSYWICELCHQPIGAERLAGKPTARTCVEHAAARP